MLDAAEGACRGLGHPSQAPLRWWVGEAWREAPVEQASEEKPAAARKAPRARFIAAESCKPRSPSLGPSAKLPAHCYQLLPMRRSRKRRHREQERTIQRLRSALLLPANAAVSRLAPPPAPSASSSQTHSAEEPVARQSTGSHRSSTFLRAAAPSPRFRRRLGEAWQEGRWC